MLGGQGLGLCLGFLSVFFSGCHAPPSSTYDTNPPVYVWPLGDNITGLELKTNIQECDSNNLDYDIGPGTPLDYNAMKFVREDSSYIDIPILHTTDLDLDIAFTFHLYPERDGTYFHYKGDNSSDVGISEIEIKVDSETFETTIASNNGSKLTRIIPLGITNKPWYRIVVERDFSYYSVKFYVETSTTGQSSITTVSDLWLKDMKTLFPGKLRLGGSQNGDSFFTGRLACLQLVDTKNPQPANDYDGVCAQNNWPTASATAPAVNVSAICGTVTTSTTKLSTTTSTASPTSTVPASTSTTTQTTSMTTATATVTLPASTTTTTITTTATMTILQTAITVPTTTTTTTLPKTVSPIWSTAVPAISTTANSCKHFSATLDATFNSISDILQTAMVDLGECVWLCVRNGRCGSFVYSSTGVCHIGVTSPAMASDSGKTMYT